MTAPRHLIRQPADDTNIRPFMVIWETTMACDLVCRHCRAEAIAAHDPLTLSTEEGKRLLDQIEQFGKPRPIVVLTGGDPFKRSDIFELTAYGTEIGLPMAISPSATPLLTYDNLLKLRTAGAKAISLSLDGSTPEIHDAFRGVSGSYQMTIDGWQAAQEIGLKVQLNSTITRHNLYDLPNIFQRALDYGVMTWSVFFLVPTGRGKLDDEVTPEQYEDVMHWLYDASKFLRIKTTEGHHYKRIVLQRTVLEEKGIVPALGSTYHDLKLAMRHALQERDLAAAPEMAGVRRTPMHINAGDGFVFISKRGDVFPSGFMPLSAGNIRQTPLVEIYRDAPLFRQLRQPDTFDGRCGVCEFRNVCGGSRSRAYAMTGNPLAEEPFCTYQPGSFAYQDEIAALLANSL